MNIMKLRPLFLIISSILLITSLLSIIFWQFKPSIDFSGGSIWEVSFSQNINTDQINEIFTKNNLDLPIITSIGDNNYSLKFKNINPSQKVALNSSLKEIDDQAIELKFETLGPILGKELLKKTIFAIVLSSLFLLLFIGSFSILGHFFGAELDSLFVTALLTTLSSSVHDTVVTFDRIRELKRKNYKIDWVQLANQAVTETLNRSINNSMTIIFMLTSLVLLGGSTTRWFAAALLIGVICGTYSSTGVAIPLVLFFKKHSKKKY